MSEAMPFMPSSEPLTPETRTRLGNLRRAMLGLHKTILETERNGYERVHGRVAPGELLQLVMRDGWFGWFRPLSELVVQIDELLEREEPQPTEHDAETLLREIRSVLHPSEEGEEFGVRYRQILQEDPAIILAHAETMQLLQT